ncbi:hypothetical protein KO516_14515 [Citreicella sp. C3M06]|nr:hypothetical protein [Citreicella sp. C3M06]
MTAIYRVETRIRSLTASQRLAVQQDKSVPMIAVFNIWLEQARAQVFGPFTTREAL